MSESNIKDSIFIEILLSVIKVYFMYIVYSKYGILIMILFFYSLFVTYKVFMQKVFGLRLLSSLDKPMIGSKLEEMMNLIGIIHLNNFDEEFTNNKLKEAMKKNKKLNSKLVYINGNYWWKDLEFSEERFNKVVRYVRNINSQEEAIEYLKSILHEILDLSETGLIIYVIPIKNGEVVIGFKNDHSFSDGLGMISILYALADEVNEDFFPKSLKNKMSLDFKQQIFNFMVFILFGWFGIFKLLLKRPKSTILNNQVSGVAKISKTLILELEPFKRKAKDLNLTINEYVLTLISSSLKKFDQNVNEYSVIIPIGGTKPCFSVEKIPLKNLMSGLSFSMPLISDVKTEKEKVVEELHQLLKIKLLTDFLVSSIKLLGQFLPTFILKQMGKNITQSVDISVSNVPGPVKKLKYGKMEILDMFPITTTGPNKAFILIFSYVDKLYITVHIEKNQKLNAQELADCIFKLYNEK